MTTWTDAFVCSWPVLCEAGDQAWKHCLRPNSGVDADGGSRLLHPSVVESWMPSATALPRLFHRNRATRYTKAQNARVRGVICFASVSQTRTISHPDTGARNGRRNGLRGEGFEPLSWTSRTIWCFSGVRHNCNHADDRKRVPWHHGFHGVPYQEETPLSRTGFQLGRCLVAAPPLLSGRGGQTPKKVCAPKIGSNFWPLS